MFTAETEAEELPFFRYSFFVFMAAAEIAVVVIIGVRARARDRRRCAAHIKRRHNELIEFYHSMFMSCSRNGNSC